MNKTYLIFLAVILIYSNINAQPGLDWQHNIGGLVDDRANGIAIDIQGNIYVVGAFEGTVDFDHSASGNFSLMSRGAKDAYLMKYSAAGNFIWARAFGGYGYDEARTVRVDNNGNIFVGGIVNTVGGSASSEDTHTYFYTNAGLTTYIECLGQSDVVIAKYNSNGSLLSQKLFGGIKSDFIEDIDLDPQGNLFVAGNFYETVDLDPGPDSTIYTSITGLGSPSSDIYFSKFDNNLNFIYGKRIGGNAFDNALAIATSSNGDFYISGTFASLADFDPSAAGFVSLQSNIYSDAFIAKYDSLGNFIYVNHVAGTNTQYATDLKVGSNGDYYVSFYSQGNIYFNYNSATPDTIISAGGVDAYLSKYNSSGTLLWKNAIVGNGSEICEAINLDNQDNVYVAGVFYSPNLVFGSANSNTQIIHPVSTTQYVNNIFLAKYDNGGNVLWAKAFGDATQFAEAHAIVVEPSTNEIIMVGYSSGTNIDFDPTSQTNSFMTAGYIDGLIVKFSPCAINVSVSFNTDSLTAATGYQSYQWYDCVNNVAILGANQNVFHPSTIGQYKVVMSGIGGCTDTSSCISVTNLPTCNINSSLSFLNGDSLRVNEINGFYQWVKCPNYTTIIGATNRTIKLTQAGNYACIVTLSPSCKDTSVCYSFGLGIAEQNSKINVRVAPNPNTGKFDVYFENTNHRNYKVNILDMSGGVLYAEVKQMNNYLNVDATNLAEGFYFINIIDTKTGIMESKKFVKLIP